MAKEDFCFTFYDGDATRDASHMNRLERGAYYDLIIAQRKFGRLSIDQIKKVLGRDFDSVWSALELSLVLVDGFYFIEWIEKSMELSRKHSRHQSENGKKGGRPPKNKPEQKPNETQLKANHNPTESQKKPLEDGIGNEDVLKTKSGVGENFIPVGIVPEMAKQFVSQNEGYFFDQETDFPCLAELGNKIHRWEKLPGIFTDSVNTEKIKLRWGDILTHIKADSHFSKYSLSQINKHFQSITQSLTNGRSQPHKHPPSGSNRQQGANQLIDSLRNDLESAAGGSYNP